MAPCGASDARQRCCWLTHRRQGGEPAPAVRAGGPSGRRLCQSSPQSAASQAKRASEWSFSNHGELILGERRVQCRDTRSCPPAIASESRMVLRGTSLKVSGHRQRLERVQRRVNATIEPGRRPLGGPTESSELAKVLWSRGFDHSRAENHSMSRDSRALRTHATSSARGPIPKHGKRRSQARASTRTDLFGSDANLR